MALPSVYRYYHKLKGKYRYFTGNGFDNYHDFIGYHTIYDKCHKFDNTSTGMEFGTGTERLFFESSVISGTGTAVCFNMKGWYRIVKLGTEKPSPNTHVSYKKWREWYMKIISIIIQQ